MTATGILDAALVLWRRGIRRREGTVGVILLFLAITGGRALAEPGGHPVSEDGGPISELSRSIGTGSQPVHERGRTLHETSAGPLSGNAVADSTTGNVTSGPVSDLSAGSVRSDRTGLRRGALQAEPSGMVPTGADAAPAGVPGQAAGDLTGLQAQLRGIRPLPRNAGQGGRAAEESGGVDLDDSDPSLEESPADETAIEGTDSSAPPTDDPARAAVLTGASRTGSGAPHQR